MGELGEHRLLAGGHHAGELARGAPISTPRTREPASGRTAASGPGRPSAARARSGESGTSRPNHAGLASADAGNDPTSGSTGSARRHTSGAADTRPQALPTRRSARACSSLRLGSTAAGPGGPALLLPSARPFVPVTRQAWGTAPGRQVSDTAASPGARGVRGRGPPAPAAAHRLRSSAVATQHPPPTGRGSQ
ncbi:hypothetical protein GCM10010400_01650 [Streptomyces aculeolatus]